MHPFSFLYHLIGGAVGSAAAVSLAIVLGTLILEDPTTVVVGLLAANGTIGIGTALASLYAGVILGDIGLYYLGRLASTHPRLGRYVDHDIALPVRAWLESRFVLTIFSARFIPGSRVPTYAASGFFGSPLSTFVLTAIVATSVWTTLLFCAAYWYGSATMDWVGYERWGVAAAFLFILFLIARHNLLAYRTEKREAGIEADIRAQ